MNDTRERFRSLEWVPSLSGINVISVMGVGGIGSHLSLLLSRFNVPLALYDFDTVEEVNLSGQHFHSTHVGLRKATAIKQQIQSFSPGTKVLISEGAITELSTLSFLPYTFSAFDNMKARKIVFDKWEKDDKRELFVDGRMLAESMEIYFVTKGREDEYRKYLYKDEDIPDLACSAKATTHCGAMIASLMIAGFTNYLANKHYGKNVREVPFKINYDLELFNQNIIYDTDISKES